jgi:hypothetical protein
MEGGKQNDARHKVYNRQGNPPVTIGLLSIVSQGPPVVYLGGAALTVGGGILTAWPTTIALGGASHTIGGGSLTASSGAGLVFNFIPSASWASAPQTYKDSLVTAANMLTAAFPGSNVTLNFEVSYGYLEENEAGTALPVANRSSAGADYASALVSFSELWNAMNAIPSPTTTLQSVLTESAAGIGLTSMYAGSSIMKRLGLFSHSNGTKSGGPASARDTVTLDGAIGMGTGWNAGELVGVLLHELTHPMGRTAGDAPANFCRYAASGTRNTSAGTFATGDYFSINGGTTNLAQFDNTSDAGDFDNYSPGTGPQNFQDPFNAYQIGTMTQYLTTLDILVMNAMGWQ